MTAPLSEWVRAAEDGGCNIYIPDTEGLHIYGQAGPVVHIIIGDGVVLEVSVTVAAVRGMYSTHRVARTPDDLRSLLRSKS